MAALKYTFVRNVCFLMGVVVALLCVVPPPDIDFSVLIDRSSASSSGVRDTPSPEEVASASFEVSSKEEEVVESAGEEGVVSENAEADDIDHVEDNAQAQGENEVEKVIESPSVEENQVETSLNYQSIDTDVSADQGIAKPASAGFLDIEMELGSGHTFRFNIDMATADIPAIATKFCLDHAEEIGVDMVNLQGGCVEPVLEYLETHMKANRSNAESANMVSIELDIQGTTVQFDVDASASDSVGIQATTFCTNYGSQFGVTENSLSECINNIRQALEKHVAAFIESQSVEHVSLHDEEPSSGHQPPSQEIGTNEGDDHKVRDVIDEPSQVVVINFPLASKDFEYKYNIGVNAAANAANFCRDNWDELEGAFVQAGMTGVDEKTCALIVEEITQPQIESVMQELAV